MRSLFTSYFRFIKVRYAGRFERGNEEQSCDVRRA